MRRAFRHRLPVVTTMYLLGPRPFELDYNGIECRNFGRMPRAVICESRGIVQRLLAVCALMLTKFSALLPAAHLDGDGKIPGQFTSNASRGSISESCNNGRNRNRFYEVNLDVRAQVAAPLPPTLDYVHEATGRVDFRSFESVTQVLRVVHSAKEAIPVESLTIIVPLLLSLVLTGWWWYKRRQSSSTTSADSRTSCRSNSSLHTLQESDEAKHRRPGGPTLRSYRLGRRRHSVPIPSVQFPALANFGPAESTGRDLALADALSRIRCDSDEPPESELENVATHATAGLSTLVSDTTAKRMAKETSEDDELRTAPLEAGQAPCELLMGRRLRARLPDFADRRATEVKKHTQAHPQRRPLEALGEHDTVRLLDKGGWTTKALAENAVAPRSYMVRKKDVNQLRRNRQHLLRTNEEFDPSLETIPDCTEDSASDCASLPGLRHHRSPWATRAPRVTIKPRLPTRLKSILSQGNIVLWKP
ncbi:uncharacterized protein LOC144127876 [Amblyomma americanum]